MSSYISENWQAGPHETVVSRRDCRSHGNYMLRVAGLIAIAAPLISGLLVATPCRAQSQLGAPPSPAFEIATVKPTIPNPHQPAPIGIFTYPRGRIVVTGYTVKMLISEAYGVNEYQVSGGPNWIDEEQYDIEAVAPASSEASKFSPPSPNTPPSPEMLLMLRSLLADRFQVKLHTETKTGPGYAPGIPRRRPQTDLTSGHDAFSLVGNQSGQKSDLDFRFAFAMDEPQAESGPSLSSAVQKQLGFKLVSIKASVAILVIDRAERPASN